MKSRQVYTRLWREQQFYELSDREKILTLYLLTNTDIGLIRCYRLPQRALEFDLGYTKQEIDKLKESLYKKGLFEFVDDWVLVLNDYSNFNFNGRDIPAARLKEWERVPRDFQDKAALQQPCSSPNSNTNNNNDNDLVDLDTVWGNNVA